MMKYLLLFFCGLPVAMADDCKLQSVEVLKNNKAAAYVDCFVANDKPLTIIALQIYPMRDEEPAGVTLSAYTNAEGFGPHSKPAKIKSRLGQVIIPFMFNDKQSTAVYEDVDDDLGEDGKKQKELVFTTLYKPHALQAHILRWNEKKQDFEVRSHSNFHDEEVDFFAGTYMPDTEYEFPILDLKKPKKTFSIPSKRYKGDQVSQSYKVFERIGPSYIEVQKK